MSDKICWRECSCSPPSTSVSCSLWRKPWGLLWGKSLEEETGGVILLFEFVSCLLQRFPKPGGHREGGEKREVVDL